MGVDIVIVVDVGFPLLKRDKLNSVPVISNQMLAILIQKNSRRQLATLTRERRRHRAAARGHLLVRFRHLQPHHQQRRDCGPRVREQAPAAGGEPARNTASTSPARDAGAAVAAAHRFRADRSRLREALRKPARAPLQAMSSASRSIRTRWRATSRPSTDRATWSRSTTASCGTETDEYGLLAGRAPQFLGPELRSLRPEPAGRFPGELQLQRRRTLRACPRSPRPGGELVCDLQIGEDTRVGSEVYLPLSDTAGWFVDPHMLYEARNSMYRIGQVSAR